MKGITGREGIIRSRGRTAGLALLAAVLASGAHDAGAATSGTAALLKSQAAIAGRR
jgi:hypothetical protein